MRRLLYGLLSLVLLLPAPTALASPDPGSQTEEVQWFSEQLEATVERWGNCADEGDSGAEDEAETPTRPWRAWQVDFSSLRDWQETLVEAPSQEEPAPTLPEQPAEPPASPAPAPAPVPASELPDMVARVVELTNMERQQAGLRPLAVNASLTASAQSYAEVLASGSCFGHQCGPVPDFAQRLESAGYTNWRSVAENIAGGQDTPEEVVATWMSSPGHRANILNPTFEEIGVGMAEGGRYGVYWVQEFGVRR